MPEALSTTGENWSAAYGTSVAGPNMIISDYRRLTEWRTWNDAYADAVRWARDYAKQADTDLLAEQAAGRKLELKVDLTAGIEQHLAEATAQVDQEFKLWIDSAATGEFVLFTVEFDGVGSTRGGK